ncbi:MAG: N-succinylarginine dihydrolase [Casimicrobiaceae bacterium]
MNSSAARGAIEANFDGLVGPTHNYSGIAPGNLASSANRLTASNPRAAALQGLDKMLALAERGFAQGVLPPQERPDVRALRRLGFAGDDAAVIRSAARDAPSLLSMCSSAASMWVANAATVSPRADTADRRTHFTPANLASSFHRALEAPETARVLQAIFADARYFAHHPPLPAAPQFGDEGAANHTRLCPEYDRPGVELFVYGRDTQNPSASAPVRFPARQTRAASKAVARLHGLRLERCVFAQQNPDAIDAGVFHNDVIAVGNRNVLFFHELAFADRDATLAAMRQALAPTELIAIMVPAARVSLASAVSTYLFNSQLLSRDDGRMLLVAPAECRTDAAVAGYLEELVHGDGPIDELLAFDLRQSMQNGGGPACLRLRVVLDDDSRAAVLPSVWMNARLHAQLSAWVNLHYRDRMLPADLGNPRLLVESRSALDELTQLLGLGSLYPFQREANGSGPVR